MLKSRILAGAAVFAIGAAALTGCSSRGSTTGAEDTALKAGDLIGVSMPALTSQNLVIAGKSFETDLVEAGFKADVQYASASNTVPDQQAQISTMVTKGAKVIIICAQDAGQLSQQVQQAKEAGITVIAWDRNILNTPDTDYYVTFNNFKVGQLQAQSLIEGMEARTAEGPYNIELFAGSATDTNATNFFAGAMDVLQPLIDSGDLVVPSGQTTFAQVSTDGWLAQNAQRRMTNLITSTYSDGTELDGVLAPNDTLGRAIIEAIQQGGLDVPIVTGQDSETASIPLIMEGTQYSTIYKDARLEAQTTVDLLTDLVEGNEPDTVTESQFNNGTRDVPTIALDPILVTKDNAVEVYANDPELLKLAEAG